MKNRGRFTENARVECDIILAASNSTAMGVNAYSNPVSLKNCDRVAFIISAGNIGATAPCVSSVSIVQAANATAILGRLGRGDCWMYWDCDGVH